MINYNSPIIKMLETLGNMMIVSVFWILCCLPIITIVPASAALYHTCVKVIFAGGNGKGVAKCFFKSFKENLSKGCILTLISLVATFFVVIGINTGLQIYQINIFGALYMAFGVLICLIIYPAVIYIPIVLSRFDGDISMVLRLSLYFASGNFLVNIEFALLVVLMAFAVGLFPLFLLVVPALYVDLIRPQMENKLIAFIKMNNLEEVDEEESVEEEVKLESISEFEQSLDQRRKSNV